MKPEISVLESPVEICIMRDGKPLMAQVFQHTPIRFGRILENDIVLPFDSISRHHCELRYSEGKWSLANLKSLNGVKVKGERVENHTFDGPGEFDLKPVTIQIREVKAAPTAQAPTKTSDSNPRAGTKKSSGKKSRIETEIVDIGATTDSKGSSFVSPTDETIVGPPASPAAQPAAARKLDIERPPVTGPQLKGKPSRSTGHAKKPVLNVDGVNLMGQIHPLAMKATKRAIQVTVLWHDTVFNVDEFLVGEEIVIEIWGVYLRLGRVAFDKTLIRCPNGTNFMDRPGTESTLLPNAVAAWESSSNIRIFARYVPQSRVQRTGLIPLLEDELIDPIILSGAIHGAVAIATVTLQKNALIETRRPPERIAKIITAAPTPPPIAMATPSPTPAPTPTPAIAKATPTPPPPPVVKATPPPKVEKKIVAKNKPKPKVAKQEFKALAPKAEKPVIDKQIAKRNEPPPAPKVEAPPAPTPKPFQATSVGALKALSLLTSGPAPSNPNTEKIVVRKTANEKDGGGSGNPNSTTTSMMSNMPVVEGGSENGKIGGMALPVSAGGAGYGTKGFSGKTGKRNVLGSVVGGASYTEISKSEGLTREQVMKVVQKNQTLIQQCYERTLMDDPNLAGRAEFEWEITPAGSVTVVSVKETNLRSGEKLLECVKGVFRKMKFPQAKNGSSTTPTIGLPFGRL